MKRIVLLMAIAALFLSMASFAFAIDQTIVAEQGEFRLVRIEYPNQEALVYSVTRKVTDDVLQEFNSPSNKKEEQPLLVRNLFDVAGVIDIQLTPYKIRVGIAPAFNREQMKINVEQAILARYGIKR